MPADPTILQIAVPTPLRRLFDYLPLPDAALPAPGCRVTVRFGRQQLIGIVMAHAASSPVPPAQLKPIDAVIDVEPVLGDRLRELVSWGAEYYQYAIGECIGNALPVLLRKGSHIEIETPQGYRLTTLGLGLADGALQKRAKRQAQIIAYLQQHTSFAVIQLAALQFSDTALRELRDKQLIEKFDLPATATPAQIEAQTPLPLNDEQQHALDAIDSAADKFRCLLLAGITGSGKTEVYLQAITHCLARGRQALVLIPEIGLTPQTLARFRARFNCEIAAFHSALTDHERARAWQKSRTGQARIIIGTRSAVFTPMLQPGLIIIDEEHDLSYKQQDGFRYSARDVAIKRASIENIPIVLGSATPSVETLFNAQYQRYQLLPLTQRAGSALLPDIEVVNIRHQQLHDGLCEPVLADIEAALQRSEQVLVFLNRRGYAPTLMCHDCGWIANCDHCDARFTVHLNPPKLHCHHCENVAAYPRQCPQCKSRDIMPLGIGTERSEVTLMNRFPQFPVMRIDRDSVRGKHAMANVVDKINEGEPVILLGTQMLAKGHHFPAVTLAVIVDVDHGFFSADFRGAERVGALITQVAGRAGRGDKPGRVLLQTHYPEHPLLRTLILQGYDTFAKQIMAERMQLNLPPAGFLALIRAEATDAREAQQWLQRLRVQIDALSQDVIAIGPLPAPMQRRAGFHRLQLLLQATQRKPLQTLLTAICQWAEADKAARRIRWSVDVDPQDML